MSLAVLLDQAIQMGSAEVSERMDLIEVAYGFDSLKEKISYTVAAHEKEMESLAEAYRKQEGIPIQIGKPFRSSINGGGLTARTLYLANGTTVSLQDTSMMANIENTWRLEVKEIPFLFQNAGGVREFKIELDLEVIVDGKSYQLRELVDSKAALSFKKILLKGKSCRFMAENKGKISIEHGKVLIKFI